MARLEVLLAISTLFSLATSEVVGVRTNNWNGKFNIIIKECQEVVDAVRKINITDTTGSLQLANIVTSEILQLGYATHALNIVTPNLVTEDTYKELSKAAQAITAFSNDLQEVLYGDSENLKHKLADIFEASLDKVKVFSQSIKTSNDFAQQQIDYALDIIIFGLFKIKYQALYFEDTNKQLGTKISTGIAHMNEALTSTTTINQDAAVEFRHLGVLLELITERLINRLQNWIELNSQDTKNVEVVKELSRNMSELFGKLDQLVTGKLEVSNQASELLKIFNSGAKGIQKLTEIEYPENRGGQEYIRSTIFDAIAVGGVYSQLISKVLKNSSVA